MDGRCFALFLLMLALSPAGFSSSLEADWLYSRPVDLSSSGILSNYQVKVVLDTGSLVSSGKMRQDCGDIRFTDSDKATLLPYWMESGCGSQGTVFWVKVPLVSRSKKIYVYYGNPSAAYAGSGDRTFEFFDDFEGVVLDNLKWDGNPTVQVSSGYVHLIRPVAGATSVRMKSRPIATGVVQMKARRGAAETGMGPGVFLGYSENANAGGIFQGADHKTGKWGLGVFPKMDWSNDGSLDSADHIFSIAYTPGRIYSSYVDSELISKDVQLADSPFTSLQLGAGDAQLRSDSYFDWILIRKYSAPEPLCAIGPEEETKGASTTKATIPATTSSFAEVSLKLSDITTFPVSADLNKPAETTTSLKPRGTGLPDVSEEKATAGTQKDDLIGAVILILLLMLAYLAASSYYKKKQSRSGLINQCLESGQKIESLKTVKATMMNEFHARKLTEEDARKMVLDCEKEMIMERSKLHNLASKLGINPDRVSGKEEVIGWIIEKLSSGDDTAKIKKAMADFGVDPAFVDDVKRAVRL
jgi:hypothetical protein